MKGLVCLCTMFIFLTGAFAQDIGAGKQHYYYQRYQSAERFFHDYLAQHANDPQAWLWLVKSYTVQDETGKARDTLSFVPTGIASEPYILLAKGHLAILNNKPDSANYFFNEAIDETKGKDAEILGLVAESNIEAPAGNYNYALEVLEKAIKRKKNDPKLQALVGDVYLKLHNGTEAYKAYTAALDKDSHFAEADYKLGTIFQSQKNVDVYLEHFNKAVANDKAYGPAYYELYRHYLYTDPAKAMDYFRQYAALSDKTLQQQYALADVLYLNKEYPKAIEQAKMLIAKEKDKVQGRLYKLIGYSYGEMKDTANAIAYMQQYFLEEEDSNLIVKDFETMAQLFESQPEMQDSAIAYYQRAIDAIEKPADQYPYYKKLAALYKANKNYAGEAASLGKYYMSNDKATNVDLFNWGLAAYRAEDYYQADSVFGKYTEKYPEQGFGYYWRARSNAAIDTSLKEGLAVPHYTKLIEVLQADSLTEGNKKWMVQAYSYLAAYETNTQSDYKEAITYFDKILEIDPENSDAKKYITVLEQNLKREETENTSANPK